MIERFDFSDLRELFAKANEQKSGDQLAGIAARSERERVAAKRKLADLTLEEIVRRPLIDPSEDDVTRLILETFDPQLFRSLGSMTVGEFREFLLDDGTTGTQLQQLQEAIIPEIAAAVAKLMSNKDLVLAAAKIRNVTRCRNTMGERGVLGIRVQPNHPADDIGGILLAAFEGLLYGCGDAGHRRQSGHRFDRHRQFDTLGVATLDRRLRDPYAKLLSGSYHHSTGGAPARGAGGPSFSIGGGHRSRQPQLRNHLEPAARGPRAGSRASPPTGCGLGGRSGDVLRNRSGQRSVGRRASRSRSVDPRSTSLWS